VVSVRKAQKSVEVGKHKNTDEPLEKYPPQLCFICDTKTLRSLSWFPCESFMHKQFSDICRFQGGNNLSKCENRLKIWLI